MVGEGHEIQPLAAAEPGLPERERVGEGRWCDPRKLPVFWKLQIGQGLCMAKEGSLPRWWAENDRVSQHCQLGLCQSIWKETACLSHSAAATRDDQVGLLATQCAHLQLPDLLEVTDPDLQAAPHPPILRLSTKGFGC